MSSSVIRASSAAASAPVFSGVGIDFSLKLQHGAGVYLELQARHVSGLVRSQETDRVRDVRGFDVRRGHRLHDREGQQGIVAAGRLKVRSKLSVNRLPFEDRGGPGW